MSKTFLAVDFGGGSGRVIAGRIVGATHDKTLVMEEVHRFPNYIVRMNGYLYWDFPYLYSEMKKGLAKAAIKYEDIASIGIDTWGVDFGFIDSLGNLIGNPISYRDEHTETLPEKLAGKIDMKDHYGKIGIQVLSINTLFRLWSMSLSHDPKLDIARHLLFMPDLLGYFLTGKLGNEYTIASTSELLNAESKTWDTELIKSIGVNPDIFGKILMPGEVRGDLLEEVAMETGLSKKVKVVCVGSHDTASAIFAEGENFDTTSTAFLSSGTWSLLGIETDNPILSDAAREAGYTNEGGVEGKITFLTNITGLWILQRLKAQWDSEGLGKDWTMLIQEAEKAGEVPIIDVDNPIFNVPDDMKGKIDTYCRNNNLAIPSSCGEYVKCVCLSLATRYKKAIDNLNTILSQPVKRIKIFGGGVKNRLLNKLTEDLSGVEVVTGNDEATAIGNILVQGLAAGAIENKKEIKEFRVKWME